MAKDQKPDATCQTNDRPNSVTDVPCRKQCKVSYRFKFGSALSMPYAVAVDGQVLPAFRPSAKRTTGQIPVVAYAGQTVELYLNSDAHPDYRKHPVYRVTVGQDDLDVLITETPGKHTDTDVPLPIKSTTDSATGRVTQHLSAKLTGDIWMKVSHRYAPSEVEPLLPPKTSAEVTAAVKSIYAGLPSPSLMIQQAAGGGLPARNLAVKFVDSDNPKQNITSYSLLKDGLPRVHPGGYAALFNAALEHGIESLRVTSCWRPMLGSIAHRAGLGLDVDYVGSTWMNRQELRKGKAKESTNVSDEEVRLFKQLEASAAAEKRADRSLTEAETAVAAPNQSAEKLVQSKTNLRDAQSKKELTARTRDDALEAWNTERGQNESAKVRLFRSSLLRCRCVAQLFDPWYMDASTRDGQPPEPNMQITSNELLHAHHLHITVFEPKL